MSAGGGARAALRVVRLLAGTIVAGAMCAPAVPPPDDLEAILGRFRLTFEEADASHLDGLYPSGWALVALTGETRRSASGDELRRGLERFFRNRTPISYQERPPSIRRSADGGYVLFVPEWTSMATGTDRYVVEAFRIGLERVAAEPAASASSRWQIREFTAWTR